MKNSYPEIPKNGGSEPQPRVGVQLPNFIGRKHLSHPVERHLNVPLLPVLAIIFAGLYFWTSYRGWLVFSLGMGGAWLLGYLWIRTLERNLWIERKIHLAWATVGESVPEEIKLVNRGWLPAMWVEMSDDSSTLEKPLRMVSDVGSHARRTRHISHLFKQRGYYSLGPTRLRCGDPLGIYTLTLYDQHTSSILVAPPVLPLPQLTVISAGWSGDENRSRGVVAQNISEAGVRNYIPGDSLRRIHWRASAHSDTLIVRQLEAAASRDWQIYVDLDQAVQAGSDQQSTLELCIVIAASLTVRGLSEHRRIGLVMAGDKLVWIEPAAGPSQRWRILRLLSMAEAGEHPLGNLLSLSHPSQASTSILITPSTDPTWVAKLGQKDEAGKSLAILVNPADFGSPANQNQVIFALKQNRVRFTRLPGALLQEAYSSTSKVTRRRIEGPATSIPSTTSRRADWQNVA